MKQAFTLAEVLITLTVIGIIATLTIPTITQNYKKSVTSTKLKKFHATMQQVISLSEISNGNIKMWSWSEAVRDDENMFLADNYVWLRSWLDKYILPYLKYKDISLEFYNAATDGNSYRWIINLLDGGQILIHYGGCIDLSYDINGEKLPNKSGRDYFAYTICLSSENAHSSGFRTYQSGLVSSREDAFSRCKTAPQFCSVLLEYDNWEFKDDYPHKL